MIPVLGDRDSAPELSVQLASPNWQTRPMTSEHPVRNMINGTCR